MLYLPDEPRSHLEQWIQAGYPNETCGLMLGQQVADRVEVVRVVQARNLNTTRAHDRYELDPRDQMAADLAAREEGLEIVGIWHSHPDHPAEPSETDRQAAWEGWSYLIATVSAEAVTAVRSWRLHGERFTEEPIQSS